MSWNLRFNLIKLDHVDYKLKKKTIWTLYSCIQFGQESSLIEHGSNHIHMNIN